MYILDKFSMYALAFPITCTKILLGLYLVVLFQQYYQGPFIWITWLRIIDPEITSYNRIDRRIKSYTLPNLIHHKAFEYMHDVFTPHVKKCHWLLHSYDSVSKHPKACDKGIKRSPTIFSMMPHHKIFHTRLRNRNFKNFIRIHTLVPITELFSTKFLFRRMDPFGV
jgi:hypothetical protein